MSRDNVQSENHIRGCALLARRVAFMTDVQAAEVRCTCAEQRKEKRQVAKALRTRGASSRNIELGVSIGEGCYIRPIARNHY